MSKSKWIVKSDYETREELEKLYKESGVDPDEYDIEDFNEIEISVVREDNKHGLESGGWEDKNKIVLFSDPEERSKEDMEWYKNVAEVVCEALNQKGL